MITLHRTSIYRTGNLAHAMAYAKEMVASVKQVIGKDVLAEIPVGGNPYRIRWTFHFNDLAEYDRDLAALRADPKFMALLMNSSEMFLAGSADDQLWRTF